MIRQISRRRRGHVKTASVVTSWQGIDNRAGTQYQRIVADCIAMDRKPLAGFTSTVTARAGTSAMSTKSQQQQTLSLSESPSLGRALPQIHCCP
jgi:hypothetical protein